jgi:tubulin polyglutamylase TTLL4
MFDKKIKTTVICDVLTLVGVRGYDKKKVHEDPDFEKPIDERTYSSAAKVPKAFKGGEKLTMDEYNLIADHEDEFSRKGNFSRVFPLAANVDYYEKFFETPRYHNKILWGYLRGGQNGQDMLNKVFKRVYTHNE